MSTSTSHVELFDIFCYEFHFLLLRDWKREWDIKIVLHGDDPPFPFITFCPGFRNKR